MVRQQEQFSLTYQRRLMRVFTTTNHSVLLRKLSRYDVYDMKPQWFIVYLLLGKQIVQFNVVLSEPNHDYTGVPQAFWGLFFFTSSLMMSIVRLVICKIITQMPMVQ